MIRIEALPYSKKFDYVIKRWDNGADTLVEMFADTNGTIIYQIIHILELYLKENSTDGTKEKNEMRDILKHYVKLLHTDENTEV